MLLKPILPLAENITDFMQSIYKLKYNSKKKILRIYELSLLLKWESECKDIQNSHAIHIILIIFLLYVLVFHMASISVFCKVSQKLMNLVMKYK